MQVKDSFFCKYPDGTAIWFAPDVEPKEGYSEKQTRRMLFPAQGKVLHNKLTNEISYGCWLKDSSEWNWEEIDIPKETIDKTEI